MKAETQTDTYILTFTAALPLIVKKWKQLNCPSTEEWINKMWYVHTVEYYSVLKKNKILIYPKTQMNLENTIAVQFLSRVQLFASPWTATCQAIPRGQIARSRVVTFIKTESWMVVFRG